MIPDSRKLPALAGFIFVSLFCIIIGGFSLTLLKTSGLIEKNFSEKKETDGSISDITEYNLRNATLEDPFISIVQRLDGSFSYVVIRDAFLDQDRFIGDVQLSYPNGESGIVNYDKDGVMEIFLTKKNEREETTIFNRLITGLVLSDGSILPVKFIDANIVNGKIVGKFKYLILSEKKQVIGEYSTHGELVDVAVGPSLATSDTASFLVAQEMLRLVYSLDGKKEARVLG